MAEIKYDVKKGVDIYRAIYGPRLRGWISKGKIRRGEVLVWRSGLSGWRKPEELEELRPYFEQWEKEWSGKRIKGTKKASPCRRGVKNVLIIEDEKDLCWLLSNILRDRGYEVEVANTGREGMAFLRRETPDMVFLDLKLPDGDGMKILSRIKEMDPGTMVTIISAYGSEEGKEEAMEKGVLGFIDKPFTEEDILESIGEVKE